MISAQHDGYVRLDKGLVHARQWRLEQDGLTVTDRLQIGNHKATASLLLHPDVTVEQEPDVVMCRVAGRLVSIRTKGGDMTVHEATWHPSFNSSIPTRRICIVMRADVLETSIAWP